MDLDILLALLPRPVSIYDLSARFPIGDIRRLEHLGFICRFGDDYRITASGKQRVVTLSDQAKRLKDESECYSRQESNKKQRNVLRAIKTSIFAIFGWFFTHTSPAALFQKIGELIKSIFH